MSHYRLKMTYVEEGPYGSEEKRTLYAWHNLGCDRVTFYDDDGSMLFSVPDTLKGNILEAINHIFRPHLKTGELDEGIEYMTEDDRKNCKI